VREKLGSFPERIMTQGERYLLHDNTEELDGPAVTALERAIAAVKQRWSVIGWVTKNVLSRAPPCFGRHVKQLDPAAFAVVSTHQRTRPAWWVMVRFPYV
jgi:hypothetical protein